jgi:hypothetical protein
MPNIQSTFELNRHCIAQIEVINLKTNNQYLYEKCSKNTESDVCAVLYFTNGILY